MATITVTVDESSCSVVINTVPVLLGVDRVTTQEAASVLQAAGISSERIEIGRDSVSLSNSLGFRDQTAIVGNPNDDSIPLSEYIVSTWTAETIADVEECIAGGLTLCEVLNEPYLKGKGLENTNPTKYAELFIALHNALVSKGIRSRVKLLFCAFGDYNLEPGKWSPSKVSEGRGWIGDAVRAQPELKTAVDGFVHHPYGRPKENQEEPPGAPTNDWGPGCVPPLHAQTVSLGFANTDFYITEFGIMCGGSGGSSITASSETEQAQWAKEVYSELIKTGYVKGIWWFAAYDTSEGNWGLFRGEKGVVPRSVLAEIGQFATP